MKRLVISLMIFIAILGVANDKIPLPVFSSPDFDLKNGIVEVFYEKQNDELKLSITVVFRDEDFPCFLVNIAYDVYRYFKYGRVEDIETFYLNLYPDGTVKGVEFPGVFSANHKFKDTKDLHGSAKFTADEMDFINGRPVIYINTWNHMFGIKPSFDTGKEKLFFDYPVSQGNRLEAERKYSWLY
ncbi:hypothetical protein AT15_08450 [Kosmotoga arenicorallina S304]|uniref:Uncharacterized protein n=1 Tax=Kosmotoga arenicorallina S304 TaxID=1453497 RepID=A0A176K1J0_9BACT|nr:hypothetical protein [Kosmotoga arenicorallina]OAA30996.1 hypothetical protein AT15_08450 [Kosmotoga arenicorallina S304]